MAAVISWAGSMLGLVDEPYNTTILNERAVELAVVFDWLPGKGAGLEVGNVLGHYGVTGHRVVDLYERASGVDNVDVFDVHDSFDWVVSVSTVEHVGWDVGRSPFAAADAIHHLRGLLNPGGRLLVTIPLGWNPPLDAALPLGASTHACYRRAGDSWVECDLPDRPVRYGPAWANAVWVGEWS
jgi:SAM-dependent methyltransferase